MDHAVVVKMTPEEMQQMIREAGEYVNSLSDEKHAAAIDSGILDRRFDRRCPDYECQLKKNHEGLHRKEWKEIRENGRRDLNPAEYDKTEMPEVPKPKCSTCYGKGHYAVTVLHPTNPNFDGWEEKLCSCGAAKKIQEYMND